MPTFLDKLIKINLYLLIFSVPLFFLPLTIWPVALNKQVLAAFLSLFCLILWLIKIFSSGKIRFVRSKFSFLVLALLLIMGLSTLFSGVRAQSFWGMAMEPDAYFNFLLFGLIFFLFANLLQEEKEIFETVYVFLSSAALLALFFLIQIFSGRPIFPWDFSQSIIFNPLGTPQTLGLFFGGAFVVLLVLLITAGKNVEQNAEKTLKESTLNQHLDQRKIGAKSILKRFKSIALIVSGILLFACIFLINHWLIWLGVALGAMIMMAEMSKTISDSFTQKDLKRFALPLLIIIVSLVFVFVRPSFPKIIAIPGEITPTYQMTIKLGFKTLKESFKNFILGSGPATWGYQFSLYRPVNLNLTDFWQIRFSQGAAVLPNFLAVFGPMSVLCSLLIIGLLFYQGLKLVFGVSSSGKKNSQEQISHAQLFVFAGAFYLLLLWFFYPLNFTLTFFGFLMLGLWVALKANQDKAVVKEFSFSQSPQMAFFTMMICVALIVGSVVAAFYIAQKYRGALAYAHGLDLINREEPKLDEGIVEINKAIDLDQKDIYLRGLSNAFLLKIQQIIADEKMEQKQKQEVFQQVVSSAEASAAAAIEINPKNSQNWLQLAGAYENFTLLGVEGAEQGAILNYEKAGELDPQNPLIPLSLGRIYKAMVEKAQIQIADLGDANGEDEQAIEQAKQAFSQSFDSAIENLEKSLALKPDTSITYYLIAQTWELKGDKEQALAYYQVVLQFEPENEEVAGKIQELQEKE